MTKELLNRVRKKAIKATTAYRVIAVGCVGGKIVVCACSHRFTRKGGGIHAEEKVMIRRKDVEKIFLFRFSKTGNMLQIEPCNRCSKHATRLGIKIIAGGQ